MTLKEHNAFPNGRWSTTPPAPQIVDGYAEPIQPQRCDITDTERGALLRANLSLANRLRAVTGDHLERGSKEHFEFHVARCKEHIAIILGSFPIERVFDSFVDIEWTLIKALQSVSNMLETIKKHKQL